MPVFYKLRFKTADKTVEDIQKEYLVNPPSGEMLEKIAEAYRNLDGAEFVGGEWDYAPGKYSLYKSLNRESETKLKEFVYLQEQDELFGSYINDRERFDKDWASLEYEPPGPMHFNKNDFEVIECIAVTN